jgi:hypothetical protein
VRRFERRYYSKIDGPDVVLSCAKSSPSRERIAHSAKPQSAGKVIAAVGRNHEHGQVEFHQPAKMPVNRSGAAED